MSSRIRANFVLVLISSKATVAAIKSWNILLSYLKTFVRFILYILKRSLAIITQYISDICHQHISVYSCELQCSLFPWWKWRIEMTYTIMYYERVGAHPDLVHILTWGPSLNCDHVFYVIGALGYMWLLHVPLSFYILVLGFYIY